MSITPLDSLRHTAQSYGVQDIASIILDDPKFVEWSGSCHDYQHHYGYGGLILHTHEVVSLSLGNLTMLRQMGYDMPTVQEVFLAGLWHDYGKIWDYERRITYSGVANGIGLVQWVGAPHKRLIHHISRSAIEWSKAVDKFPKYRDIENSVTHAILAHHGQRAWGSPVSPKSRLAWLLHFADCMSARMNDADKMDVVKHYGV